MDLLTKFYRTPETMKETLTREFERFLEEEGISRSDLPKHCGPNSEQVDEFLRDSSKLRPDIFSEICFVFGRDIEDAMPIEISPEDKSEICTYMREHGFGIVASSGLDATDNVSTVDVPVEEQVELYARLRILEEWQKL